MGNTKSLKPVDEAVPAESDAMLKDDTLVVLVDYPSPDISEPIFRMGEKLKGLSEEGAWWKVRSTITGQDNYIPSIYVAKVYHGWLFEGVERKKAEELLQLPVNPVGSFMIRESSKERGVYSLSVRHRSVKHYKIFRLANSWYYISPRLTFQCLEDLVNHYSDTPDGLCCLLTAPCLAMSNANLSSGSQVPPPVVMRRNFEWKNVNRSQLLSTNYNDGVSYGVRNSIASYLSLVGDPNTNQSSSRQKKSKSMYLAPDHNNLFLEED